MKTFLICSVAILAVFAVAAKSDTTINFSFEGMLQGLGGDDMPHHPDPEPMPEPCEPCPEPEPEPEPCQALMEYNQLLRDLDGAVGMNDQDAKDTAMMHIGHMTHHKAILVVDLNDFTSTAFEVGFHETLAQVRVLLDAGTGIVEMHGGMVVKEVGDDIFALFDTVYAAVQAVNEIEQHVIAYASTREAGKVIPGLSAGISFGEVDVLGDCGEAYGMEVNFAFDAGEEHAVDAQTLLTDPAKDQLEMEGHLDSVTLIEHVMPWGGSTWEVTMNPI